MCCQKNTIIFTPFDMQCNLSYNYTMKSLISSIVALSVASSAFSQSWNDPTIPFDATTSRIHKGPISIEWRIADGDINAVCEKASKDFGNNGFRGQKLEACAFWWGSKCIIITKKKPTMHDVGHEVRHCFYGDWH